ncbi:MAG TPA: YihY/virulence factor BrkB family protein [Chitinophagaceae bacterium]|nr:YihY/virulence factor BrkB family protein [Chitinophagaceae bacterium]
MSMQLPRPARMVKLLKAAFREFRQNDPLRMAAATAFFTTFALPPILIIVIQLFGLFVSRRTVSHHIFERMANLLGQHTVDQIRETLRNVRHLSLNWVVTTAGFVFLIFVATTLFKVIKDSLNQVWKIQLRDKQGVLFMLGYRAKSVAIIVIGGILFLAVLLAEATGAFLQKYDQQLGHITSLLLTGVIHQLVSAAVIMAWFTIVFKFLADAHPGWKVAVAGGVFTGLLFAGGKWLLRWLLSYSNMQTIYGASTSSVLLLLFVFYCSFMFYFGACFTKVWAEENGQPIPASKHAIRYRLQKIEIDQSA